MRGRKISALGLVAFAVVMHAGCGTPTCPSGYLGPYDNRDRVYAPHTDQDWICLKLPEKEPPPVPPDLEGYRPTEDTRLRDLATAAKAVIFLQSCDPGQYFRGFNVTEIIEATYGSVMRSVFEQAILDHSNCFQNKTNGCDAVRECLGIAATPMNLAFTPGCNGHIAMTRFGNNVEPMYDVWSDCSINHQESNKGVDLACYTLPYPHCAPSRVMCSSENIEWRCDSDTPAICLYSSEDERFYAEQGYSCADYGLTCALTDDGPKCMGEGAACEPFIAEDDKDYAFFADFRTGFACEDEKTLRACINGRESLVDCTNLGLNIKCIDGSRPHCGADFQCNYDRANALPTCEGTLIHVCNAGLPMTFDCVELGFETCDPVRGACKPNSPSVE